MNIEIRDTALEARIQRRVQATGSGSVEEVLAHLLETQEEQDRWLLENKEAINGKIRRGLEQLDRGEVCSRSQGHTNEMARLPFTRGRYCGFGRNPFLLDPKSPAFETVSGGSQDKDRERELSGIPSARQSGQPRSPR